MCDSVSQCVCNTMCNTTCHRPPGGCAPLVCNPAVDATSPRVDPQNVAEAKVLPQRGIQDLRSSKQQQVGALSVDRQQQARQRGDAAKAAAYAKACSR